MDEQFVHEDQMRNARTQGVGSMVSEQNRQNALELMRKMHKIDTQNAAANMRNPSDFVESNNVKLKETNASGKKIGSSMPVEWDDSEYTTCKMATTWLNTFNKA